MKLETNILLQNCFSRIIAITSTQHTTNFTSVKETVRYNYTFGSKNLVKTDSINNNIYPILF